MIYFSRCNYTTDKFYQQVWWHVKCAIINCKYRKSHFVCSLCKSFLVHITSLCFLIVTEWHITISSISWPGTRPYLRLPKQHPVCLASVHVGSLTLLCYVGYIIDIPVRSRVLEFYFAGHSLLLPEVFSEWLRNWWLEGQSDRVGKVKRCTAALPDYESVIISLTPAIVCLIPVSAFSAAVKHSGHPHPNSVNGYVMDNIASWSH